VYLIIPSLFLLVSKYYLYSIIKAILANAKLVKFPQKSADISKEIAELASKMIKVDVN